MAARVWTIQIMTDRLVAWDKGLIKNFIEFHNNVPTETDGEVKTKCIADIDLRFYWTQSS